jgi:Phospholipase_D-nuclease N-terminal
MTSTVPMLPSALQTLLGLYGFLLPLLLYVVWSTLAFLDLGRRNDIGTAKIWLWSAIIFLIPVLGALAYLLIGGGRTARPVKLAAIGGGIAAYGLVLLLGSALGGIA